MARTSTLPADRQGAVYSCSRHAPDGPLAGGVPEHVLFDNTKAAVIERDAYGPGVAPLERAPACVTDPRRIL